MSSDHRRGLGSAGCGDKGANPQAAAQRASDITKAQVGAFGGLPGATIAMKDDAQFPGHVHLAAALT